MPVLTNSKKTVFYTGRDAGATRVVLYEGWKPEPATRVVLYEGWESG